jgi:hypothetical protein
MNTKPIIFSLFLSVLSPWAMSATHNACDDLYDSGTTDEDLQKQSKAEKEETSSKRKSNIEIKTFKEADLLKEGFGKPFFAIQGDYRHNKYSEDRLTKGDALCKYLGYEKVIESKVSKEMYADKENNNITHKKGWVIDTNFLGIVSKQPEMYEDKDLKYVVRKYVEIKCAKRIDKSIDPNSEAFKGIKDEPIKDYDPSVMDRDTTAHAEVNNESRTKDPKKPSGSTQYGYKPPEWMNDSSNDGGAKK